MNPSSRSHVWDNLIEQIQSAFQQPAARVGLRASQATSTAFLLSLLARQSAQGGMGKSWVLITTSDEEAARWEEDLLFFHALIGLSPNSLSLFPEWETLPYEPIAPPVDLVARRMRTLRRLVEGERTFLVTSLPALVQRLLPRSVLSEASRLFRPGLSIEREDLIAHLLRLGYTRGSVVEIPGEFSIRGGIVDIFSTAFLDPLRIEFLGDTIESLRFFDPSTQQSTTKLHEAWILPARELIYPQAHPNNLRPLPPDAEWQSSQVYPHMEMLLDYFSDSPVIMLDQPHVLAAKAEEFSKEIENAYDQHHTASDGSAYPSPDHLYLSWDDVQTRLNQHACLGYETVTALDPIWNPVIPIPAQSPGTVGLGQRGTPFLETLQRLEELRTNGQVVIAARSRGQVDRLLALLAEHDAPAARWAPPNWKATWTKKSPFFLTQGTLSSGFISPDGQLALITEEELFAKGLRHRTGPKTKTATFLSSLEDLKVGDLIVHIQYGIGRYEGLHRLDVQGFESDFLILEFAGNDKLYVPLDRLNQVQRYSGADGHTPRLDRLGGTSWARTTARVKKGIEEMAHELVELYASRELVRREEYGVDSSMTHAFEAAFEFEETADQLRVIEEIKKDMESPKPMDRLVCGDVGYGKTEVAIRAAFKAVENDRQVAVLVPTTLLAQQHFENFSQRFAPFPTRVEVLSRFQSAKQTKSTLKDLATGTVDVVIGTHRLVQKDVQFKNLGLVIIDEEQWFGVRHKERLKQMRTQVDVLTLTATPIPRTLQMAMASVRDLSVIETPPAGRLAIRTQVLRFNESVIREAIVREIGRGGQIYFVHNKVQTIERIGTWIQSLVPEARILVAHGQMDERLLESVMLKFIQRDADVLVTSAIIQSGLDVPNANTILVNRADMFGLSQLYQLRGRVGRGGHQAYAYFLTPDEGTLTTEAQKRLIAIQEFTELGAGFRIAAADLEIRGAGNLLGKQQSGHIAAIGLDLYIKMVEEAVQLLRGQPIKEERPDPTLHIPISAFIPEDYMTDTHQRLSFYKRLSGSVQVGDLAILHGEMLDRYGPPPEPVERLYEVMQVRVLAKLIGVTSVEMKASTVVIVLDPKSGIPEEGMSKLMDQYHDRLRMLSPLSFELHTAHQDWAALHPELTGALQTLVFCDTK